MTDCVREVLRAELTELHEQHAATPARKVADRVRIAQRIKNAEREIDAYDRQRAACIQGGNY